MRRACTKKFTSRNLTFKAHASRLIPAVNSRRKITATKRYGSFMKDTIPKKTNGIRNRANATIKWKKLESIIERGIIARGNAAFLISPLSKTIDGVAFVRDREKKFHIRRPVNKKK